MPFQVTPSKSVDINMSDAAADDVLGIINEDKSRIYIARDPESKYGELRLIPGLIPNTILDHARSVVRNRLSRLSESYYSALEQWFKEQAFDNLSEALVERLLSRARVRGGLGSLNIGTTVELYFTTEIPGLSEPYDAFATWSSPAPIKLFLPMTEFAARVDFAARN